MNYATIAGWAVDFVRATRERPLLAKIVFRFVIGRYAYREFIGMMDALEVDGFVPYLSYELEQMDYHQDALPFVNWWDEREPIKKIAEAR